MLTSLVLKLNIKHISLSSEIATLMFVDILPSQATILFELNPIGGSIIDITKLITTFMKFTVIMSLEPSSS